MVCVKQVYRQTEYQPPDSREVPIYVIRGKSMIKYFEEILDTAGKKGPKKMVVAVAQDEDVLKAVVNAYGNGIANSVLVGDKSCIEQTARDIDLDISGFDIIHVADKVEACRKAVELIHRGEASMLMKGFVDTPLILKAVLDRDMGLMRDALLSHVGVLAVQGFDRLFVLSDAAMNIAPGLLEKAGIIKNAVRVAHVLGCDMPRVAVVCAVDEVDPEMPATVDAAELTEMNQRGEIQDCIVGGPFTLDSAISVDAARHNGLCHPVAGNADVLIMPDIETGNMLNKSMEYFAGARKAGVIMGAGAPIVLTSRASSDQSKLNSIALAALIADI